MLTGHPFPTAPLPDDRIEEAMQGREPWIVQYVQLIHEQRRNWLDDLAEQMRDAA